MKKYEFTDPNFPIDQMIEGKKYYLDTSYNGYTSVEMVCIKDGHVYLHPSDYQNEEVEVYEIKKLRKCFEADNGENYLGVETWGTIGALYEIGIEVTAASDYLGEYISYEEMERRFEEKNANTVTV